MKSYVKALLIATPFTFASVAFADLPPKDSKPLSDIIKMVEKAGYTPTNADVSHGKWEIEAYKNGQKRELKIEPSTGKVLSDHPD